MTNRKNSLFPFGGSDRLPRRNARRVGSPLAAPGLLVPHEPAQFAARFGAGPATLAEGAAFTHQHGREVADPDWQHASFCLEPMRLSVPHAAPPLIHTGLRFQAAGIAADSAESRAAAVGSGTAAAVPTALAAKPGDSAKFRCRSGPIHVPAIIQAIFGRDDRPQPWPHFRLRPPDAAIVSHAVNVWHTPLQTASAWEFRSSTMGNGQCVAIIERRGGFKATELDTCFKSLGLIALQILTKAFDGADNSPSGDADTANSEVLLDTEAVGAVAPWATIAAYLAAHTDAGFRNALATAIPHPVTGPSAVAASRAGPQLSWTAQAMKATGALFQDGVALGVAICCAAGNDGSCDQRAPAPGDGVLPTDFPASPPLVVAGGGSPLQSTLPRRGKTVCNSGRGGATGGGVSAVFPMHRSQERASITPSANPGLPVGWVAPDCAGHAINVDNRRLVISGASAVAPLCAVLTASCDEQFGQRLGFLDPVLYNLPRDAQTRNDCRIGDNGINGRHGTYRVAGGWGACTGLGSVRRRNVLAAPRRSRPADYNRRPAGLPECNFT